jgi:hypothetical protein
MTLVSPAGALDLSIYSPRDTGLAWVSFAETENARRARRRNQF